MNEGFLPPINNNAPPAPSNLLRSDWSFESVAQNAQTTRNNKRLATPLESQRPGSKEGYGNHKGLPPVYSKWLVQYWLYSNRAKTCPVDRVNLSGWPIDKVVAGCIATICKRALSLRLAKCPGVNDNILHRLSFLSKITILDVSGCNEITDTGIDIIRRHFPRIDSLSLSKLTQITRLSIVPLIKTLKKCRSYNFSGCIELTDAIMEAFTFSSTRCFGPTPEYVALEDLNVSNCMKLTAAGLGPFLQKCTTLVELKLQNCIGIEGIGFAPMQEIKQLYLHVLDLGGMPQIQDVDFAWICTGVPNCQNICLDSMSLLTDKSIKMLCDSLYNLTTLSLKGCINITDTSLFMIAGHVNKISKKTLRNNKKIKKKALLFEKDPETTRNNLDLQLDEEWERAMQTLQRNDRNGGNDMKSGSGSGSGSGGTDRSNNRNGNSRNGSPPTSSSSKPDKRPLHQLTCLDITDAKHITLEAVACVYQSCPQLTNLKISQVVAGVSHRDKSFKQLSDTGFFKHVTTLSIFNCGALTEKSLSLIAKKSIALTNLDCTGCMQMNDVVLQHLGMSKASKIRKMKKLNLMNCKLITDNGISMLISTGNMKALEILNVRSCVNLTDGTLYALSNTAKSNGLLQLHSLTMSGISNITNEGVIHIVRSIKTLLKFDLGGCHRISSFTLELLPQIVPLAQSCAGRGRKGLEPRGTAIRECLSRLMYESRAARRLQRKYRVRLMGKASFRKKERERLDALAKRSKSVQKLQAWWRGMMCRVIGDSKGMARKMHRRRLVRGMCKKIQSVMRMYLAILHVQTIREHYNAIVIQKHWRGKIGRQIALTAYNRFKAGKFLKRLKNKQLMASYNTWVEQVDIILRVRALAKRCFGTVLLYCYDEWKLFILLRNRLKNKCAKDIQKEWKQYCIRKRHWAATKLQGLWRVRNARQDVMERKRLEKEQNSKIQLQLRRLKFRLLIKVLLALERHAIQCRRVKSLAMRCMQSSTRVFFDKLYRYYTWRRGLRVAAALLVQCRFRGWKGRIRAFGYKNIAGANRLRRNERVVREELKLRRRRRHAHWNIANWWRRSLLRWRAPMYLTYQRKFSSTELQRIIRGYLARGYAYKRWKTWTAAANTIQRIYRGYLGRKEAARQRTSIALQRAAILIQRAYRRKRANDMREEMMRKEINASINIQRVYRGHNGREHSREQRWELHLEHLRSFAAKVQQTVGLAPSNERNQKAMRAVRDIKKDIQTNNRKIRNRLAKMAVLEEENMLAKHKCGEVVKTLLDHRTRIASITEGIFHDSVKRSDLVDMHRYLQKHRNALKKGITHFHQALRDECRKKQLLSPKDFDEILTKNIGVTAPAFNVAPRTKLIKLAPSNWAKIRLKARQRDEPPPDNELPLDDDGKRMHPPPPMPFQWPFLSAYCEDEPEK